VFHGTFAFSFDPNKPEGERFTVVAPLVKDAAHPETDHVYKAGNFLEELELSPGAYRLLGATAGNVSSPDRKQFAAVQRVHTHNPMETNVIFKMPLPDKFRGLRYMQPKDVGDKPVDLFQDGVTKTENDVRPVQVPLVFVATYKNVAAPSLVDGTSMAKWTSSGAKNLHIYAEPPKQCPDKDHPYNALSELCGLFTPALDLKLNPNLKDELGPAGDVDPCDEVPEKEQQALCEIASGLPFTKIRNCQALLVTPPA